MAARGLVGLLLCMALLLAMPALAATPADRGKCAASADKPDVGFEACSRIIDDASASAAQRVNAFKNRGRGSFNSKNYDRAIADYGEAIKLSPKDAWAFAHRCEAYESKEDHDAAIADCAEAIKIDPKYGWAYNNRGIAYYGLHEYDAALAAHSSRSADVAASAGIASRRPMQRSSPPDPRAAMLFLLRPAADATFTIALQIVVMR